MNEIFKNACKLLKINKKLLLIIVKIMVRWNGHTRRKNIYIIILTKTKQTGMNGHYSSCLQHHITITGSTPLIYGHHNN